MSTMPGDAERHRVSIVLHSFDRGGSGRVAGYLARGFADAGLDVEILVISQGGAGERAALDLMRPAVPVRYLGKLSGWRALDLIVGLPALVRTLRRDRPEVVLAAANNSALVTAIAFRLARLRSSRLYIKTTNPIASSRHRGIVRWLRRLGYRLILPWVSGVLTLSIEESAEMDEAFPAFAGQFHDVRNPYVTPEMLAEPERRTEQRKTIIAVARLEPQKRLERLILAFARIADKEAQLLILGEGAAREMLVALVRRLGLEHRVSMPGQVSQVVPALQAADLFVLTSDYEGLPAAAIEAMAANCPVLSTPCFPSARALLEPAEGCAVIEDVEPDELAELIDALLTMPRPKTLRPIAERYSIEKGVYSHLQALFPDGYGLANNRDV